MVIQDNDSSRVRHQTTYWSNASLLFIGNQDQISEKITEEKA